MGFSLDDRVRVVNVNYNHSKRVQQLLPSIMGMKGTIIKKSILEENAYNIKLDNGINVLLYDDEIELI
ncbi:MAG TPA: hypothetical protein VNQ57_09830 [Ureibacillus sp.]|nr:hypothetical protein [Ureibacillus sp.]